MRCVPVTRAAKAVSLTRNVAVQSSKAVAAVAAAVGCAQVKQSRRAKELASLAPWAWDPNVDKHKPGRAMMRDFTEVRVAPRIRAVGRCCRVPGGLSKFETRVDSCAIS